jgi:hypothetical protein
MIALESGPDEPTSRDFLSLHLRALPYFRALLRSVESSYFQRLPLPRPIYDVGCGDGQFAAVTFPWQVDVGLDLGRASVREAKTYGGYRFLVEADAASSPFRSAGARPRPRSGSRGDGPRAEARCAFLFQRPEPTVPFRVVALARLGPALHGLVQENVARLSRRGT